MLITKELIEQLKGKNLYFQDLELEKGEEIHTPSCYDRFFPLLSLEKEQLKNHISLDLENKENVEYLEELHTALLYFANDELRRELYELIKQVFQHKKRSEIVCFFEQHLNKLQFDYLCANEKIPLSFVEQHFEKVNWILLCSNKSIPYTFFEKHLDKVDWFSLSSNQNIPYTFFEQHLDKVIWEVLCCNINIPDSFF